MAMPASQVQVLVTLAGSEAHGYGIMQAIRSTGDQMGPATLYTSIARLLDLGLIEELDERPEGASGDARRRYFRITTTGRAALVVELDRLHTVLERAANAGIDRRAWRPSGPTRESA
jgi:DNA-binding PadR family transcriptional regulator